MPGRFEEAFRLQRAGDLAAAEALYRDCLRSDPRHYPALYRLGMLLGQTRRFEEAQAMLAEAARVEPKAAEAHFVRGYILGKLARPEEALACYSRALALNPRFREALLNRAGLLFALRKYEAAAADYGRLLALDPLYPYARGNRFFCRLWCCDWRDFATERAALIAGVKAGQKIVAPFDGKVLPLSAEDDLAAAILWREGAAALAPLWRGEIYAHEKIRIAYLSANFHDHPVGRALESVLAAHDRTRFEIFAISFGPEDGSAPRRSLRARADHFLDVRAADDEAAAKLLRGHEIDIAVDLMGFTEDCRPDILAHRAAPVQVNYLGYPGTMGAAHLDYILADRVVIAEAGARAYAEKIVTLPGSFMPVGPRAASACTRAEAGLPADAFVFAAFHAPYKIAPAMFALWMRLLQAVPGSVLWLAAMNEAARFHLATEAEKRGVARARLIFAPYLESAAAHIARLACADLGLDALPYNAHASGADALLAGLPLVSALGAGFAGFVGASLLRAAGLPELAVESPGAYESLALRLARDPALLADTRAKLARARTTAPLFDIAAYTRHLERAFTIMHETAQRKAPPRSFTVPEA